MPFKVRLKIAAIVLSVAVSLGALAAWSWPLAIVAGILGLIYLEMIWPRLHLFYGSAIQNVRDQGDDVVALTFDDGPSLWTDPILDSLKKHQVRATFFLLGKNVERHPEIARRIQEEGHVIGYHSYSHARLHRKGPSFIREDLNQCVNAFTAAGISAEPLIRFPHGVKNWFAIADIKRRGWTLAAWGRGVWDSKRPGVEIIVERAKKLKAGEILLLHDGNGIQENPDRSQTAEAVERILSEQKRKWVTLHPSKDRRDRSADSEILRAREARS